MRYFLAFVTGGVICLIGQIIKDRFGLKPAKVLIIFLSIGLILGSFGLYDKIIDFAGAGASVPLPSFGNSLAKGVIKAVREEGLVGILSGGIKGGAIGVSAAILFAFIVSVIFNPKTK